MWWQYPHYISSITSLSSSFLSPVSDPAAPQWLLSCRARQSPTPQKVTLTWSELTKNDIYLRCLSWHKKGHLPCLIWHKIGNNKNHAKKWPSPCLIELTQKVGNHTKKWHSADQTCYTRFAFSYHQSHYFPRFHTSWSTPTRVCYYFWPHFWPHLLWNIFNL